jgi:hypothetical protein
MGVTQLGGADFTTNTAKDEMMKFRNVLTRRHEQIFLQVGNIKIINSYKWIPTYIHT